MKRYFLWWVERPGFENGGEWYGPRYLTDLEAFNEQLSIQTNTPGMVQARRGLTTSDLMASSPRAA